MVECLDLVLWRWALLNEHAAHNNMGHSNCSSNLNLTRSRYLASYRMRMQHERRNFETWYERERWLINDNEDNTQNDDTQSNKHGPENC